MDPLIQCGGCGHIFTKTYGYSFHKCATKPITKPVKK